MYSWKWISFALCLVSVPLDVSADPPDHAAKKAAPDVLMARHAEAPATPAADAPQQRGHKSDEPKGALMVGSGAPSQPAQSAEKLGRDGAEGSGAPRPPTAAAISARGRSLSAPEGATVEGADGSRRPTAASARGPRSDVLEGLRASQGNLQVAAQRLEQSASLRERAEQARSRAWTRWKAKLLTEDAIDPRVQRELEKHARREAKLQRLGALAQQADDTQALERLAKLQALEASLHEKHMQALMAKTDHVAEEPAQP